MKKHLVVIIFLLSLVGCLKEMPEKEITVSVKEEDPIKILQGLTRETKKTEVMILGCPHFRSMQQDIDEILFDSLLIVLNNFKPDQIGIQSLNPSFVLSLYSNQQSFDKITKGNLNQEVNLGLIAQKKLKTNFYSASKTVDSLTNQLTLAKNSEISETRNKIILNFVASFNIYSAALQWKYLTIEERTLVAGIPEEIKNVLDSIINESDEINLIAITLAEQTHLQKLIPIDDQQDKDIYTEIQPKLMNEIIGDSLYIKAANSGVYDKTDNIFKEAYKSKNLLPYFRFINSREYAIKDAEAQWGVFYKLNLESGLDRTRAALWEVRNLNIASNIRRATSLNPGSKFLVIVDPSHKPFLEAYLSSLGDLKIVQFNSLLN